MGKNKHKQQSTQQASDSGGNSTNRIICESQKEKVGFVESLFGIPKIRSDIASLGLSMATFGSRFDGLKALEVRVEEISGKIDKLTVAERRVAELETKISALCEEGQEALKVVKRDLNTHVSERDQGLIREKELTSEIEALRVQIDSLLSDATSAYIPNDSMEIFGLSRRDLEIGNGREKFSALRAWCDLLEWTEDGDATGFVRQFRRVDSAVEALQERDVIRRRIAVAVRSVIAKSLKAAFDVSWDFIGEAFDENRHYTAGGGTKIVAAHGALITRDGQVLDKALVVCE